MTQDIKHLPSLREAKKSVLAEAEASGEGAASLSLPDSRDIGVLKEQLRAAQDSIKFLQSEHASLLKGLHEEIERLQDLCRDLQFRCEAGGCLLPDSDFFKCSPETLQQKVTDLIQENCDLKRRLSESHQAIDILDQKEKLALWQHHQELEQRDSAILRLQKELESTLSQLTTSTSSQGARRKKTNFWRRFSFASSNHPSTSVAATTKVVQPPRVEHLSKEDLPSEILQSMESQYQSYSSYSSLSDKSLSEDEGFKLPPITNLPPISNLQVRHQLRLNRGTAADSLAIDQPEVVAVKRLNKA